MKRIELKSRINKVLSVLVIYALFFNELVPFTQAMNMNDEFNIAGFASNNYAEKLPMDAFVDEVKSDVIENEKDKELFASAPPSIQGAMSSGAGQAETAGFSINSTDGMVDKFTGDFAYSIPLMSVEGYPIVLNYNSNVTMVQEASWVGLGWNLNVGSISREMRGIPDEFNGTESVTRLHHEKENWTTGKKNGGYFSISGGGQAQTGSSFGGGGQITALFGSYYDNVLGSGKTIDLGLGGQFSVSSSGDHSLFLAPNFNLGFNYDTKKGIGTSQSIGVSAGVGPGEGRSGANGSANVSFGQSTNSRVGLLDKSVSLGLTVGYQKQHIYTTKSGAVKSDRISGSASIGSSSTVTYGTHTMVPRVLFNSVSGSSNNTQFDAYLKFTTGGGLDLKIGYINQSFESESLLDINTSNNTLIQPAYGYMHSGKRAGNTAEGVYPIMDFNRGNDSEFSEDMKNLPFSIQTHDIFYVNASGMGATFRPQRKDYGTYYDPETVAKYNKDSKILSNDDQSEFSVGIVLDATRTPGIGFGIGYGSGTMKGDVNSGNWSGVHVLNFEANSAGNDFDNSVYFRSVGEHTPVDVSSLDNMNGSQTNVNVADAYDAFASGDFVALSQDLLVSNQTFTGSNLNNLSQETYSATTFDPKVVAGLTGNDAFYSSFSLASVNNGGTESTIQRSLGSVRKSNHLSAVEVVSPDGTHYTYGIPVYNVSSSEVSFACGEDPVTFNAALTTVPDEGMVKYTAGEDNSTLNDQGRTNYFDKTVVPSYPHSFLLTEMTGSDYIDRTNDGPTMDDMGAWYKFNHTRLYTEASPYQWRFPVSGGTDNTYPRASHSRGVLGSTLDDMASYSYGEKEIWYTHSVESKNFIAVFYLEDRLDAYGVKGENGQLDPEQPLKRLDKIVLYNRSEWIKKQNDVNYELLPLQTVEFTYDYSLCEGAPGNFSTYNGGSDSGKLTLKEIRVFSGNSRESGLSAYTFDYGSDPEDNPDFSYYNVDAWGSYKPNNPDAPNDIAPYTVQDALAANSNAQAWKLKAINNPSGGRIEIDYEADRYATVQRKRAMRHFNIFGMIDIFRFLDLKDDASWNPVAMTDQYNLHHEYSDLDDLLTQTGVGTSSLTSTQETDLEKAVFKKKKGATKYTQKFGAFDLKAIPQNVIIFELDKPIPNTNTDITEAGQKIKDLYFKTPSDNPNAYLRELLFKVHVEIESGVNELVPVQVDISSDYSNAFDNLFQGYLSDEFTAIGAMPITTGGTDYQYGYVIIDPVNTGDREEISGDGKDKVEKGSMTINPLQLMSLQFARQYLNEVVYDNTDDLDWKVFWGQDIYEEMIKNFDFCQRIVNDSYGSSELSTLRLCEPDDVKFGGNSRVSEIRYMDNWDAISGEYQSTYAWEYTYSEGTDRGPIETGVASYEGRNAMDENAYFNWDSYINIKKKFPDERKITPTPLGGQLYPVPVVGYRHVEVRFNGSDNYGHSESDFHTYQEYKYSTKEYATTIDKDTYIKKRNYITGETADVYGRSQGYLVETNDFHGKPSETRLYDPQGNLISRSSYDYYELGESIPMIDRNGVIENENVAIEFDIHADARYTSDKNVMNHFSASFELYWQPPVIFTPNFGIGYVQNKRHRAFYSHALIKHVNYSAVLKGVTTEYLGSINKAENLLYDKYTGQPVLTSLNDEFNDKLYSLSFPAHWHYREFRDLNSVHELMQNSTITIDANGTFIPGTGDILAPGDEVTLDGTTAYVAQSYPVPDDGSLYFVDAQGALYSPGANTYAIVLVKSERENRLAESMQSIVTKVNPIVEVSGDDKIVLSKSDILSSGAITYRDRLSVPCGIPCVEYGNNNELTFGASYNPYLFGIRGELVPDAQFAWQDTRVGPTHTHKTRFDGAYSSYEPFYALDANDRWVPITNANHPDNDPVDALQKWRKSGEVTTFDKFGKALEAKDQLDIYSSTLYGYSSEFMLVPIAQAVNARQSDIAFDGFEDYAYMDDPNDPTCVPAETHFDFVEQLYLNPQVEISTDERHSGLASLRIPAGEDVMVTKEVATDPECSALDVTDAGPNGFLLDDECACIMPFEPSTGEYIIGAWVKQAEGETGAEIIVAGSGLSTPVTMTPTGVYLDGWQRLEGSFEIVNNGINDEITVTLKNDNASGDVYFDDIRIHPFLAGMTTTVYDPKTLLPLATHDGYNYTTFFNYDENLNQVRTRIETVEGIKTITEVESSGQKNY